jgi:hypothetical protein
MDYGRLLLPNGSSANITFHDSGVGDIAGIAGMPHFHP